MLLKDVKFNDADLLCKECLKKAKAMAKANLAAHKANRSYDATVAGDVCGVCAERIAKTHNK